MQRWRHSSGDRVLFEQRYPPSARPRSGRHSPPAEPSLNADIQRVTPDTEGPVSTAWFDWGPLRPPRGVGHTLRQTGPPV